MTLLLTTQYLEEADQLTDHIVVIDRAGAIAHRTADALKLQIGGEHIELVVDDPGDVPRTHELLARIDGSACVVDPDDVEPVDWARRHLR